MIEKYFNHYSQNYISKWLVLTIDLALVSLTFLLTYFIRFNFSLNFDLNSFTQELPVVVFFAAFSFLLFGSYKRAVRHFGFKDVINVFMAVSVMTLLIVSFVFVNRDYQLISELKIPLSIIVINAIFTFVVLSSVRLLIKIGFNALNHRFVASKRILICGSKDSLIATYNALMNDIKTNFNIVGFICDSNNIKGKLINGLPVYTPNQIDLSLLTKKRIDEVIFTSQNSKIDNLIDVIENLTDSNIKITKLPSIEQWVQGNLQVNHVKSFPIEDLLERKSIQIDNTNVPKEFKDEIILVTGAASVIGSDLVRQLSYFNPRHLLLLDMAEASLFDLKEDLTHQGFENFTTIVGDIRDGLRVDGIFQHFKPTIVFHTAGYSEMSLMEQAPYESVKINVNGTKILADTASRYNVKKFILASTNKAVNPSSVMGATKRIAETYITCLQKESKTKFITARLGNVLGADGCLIAHFNRQIIKGGPLKISHEESSKYFMNISEASQLMLEAGTMGRGGEIFIFDVGKSINIYYLAKNLIERSGLRLPEDINIEISGLRPGEKLNEELLGAGENKLPTYHKKVMITKIPELNYEKVKADIESLCIKNRFQNDNIVSKIKQLIPEYKSTNLDFEKYKRKVRSYENIEEELKTQERKKFN